MVHHFDTLNYDELLDRKIRLEYEKMNPYSNPSKDLVRRTEQRIMNTILAYEDGISHQELADIIGIDRNNLRPYMKRLMQRGMVTRDKGKQGKYHAATKARRGIRMTADILANSFMSNILDNENFAIDIPFLDMLSVKLGTFSGLELELLRLSNMFGAFMIYTLIQSMNPENKITEGSRNIVEKDLVVQAWIDDAIAILMRDILFRFKGHVFDYIEPSEVDIPVNLSDSKIFNLAGNQYTKFFHKRPFFTLDKHIISQLINSFNNLYPNLGRELEKTMSELPKLVAQEIKRIKEVAKRVELQKKCLRHDYETIEEYSYNNDRFERCRKCQKTRKRYVYQSLNDRFPHTSNIPIQNRKTYSV
jgi:predicted transcriptional regulator